MEFIGSLQFPEFTSLSIGILGVIGIVLLLLLLLFNKKLFVLALLALIPFSIEIEIPNTGTLLSMPSEVMISVVSLIFIARIFSSGISKRILQHPLTLLIILDISWLLISTLFSTDPSVSAKRVFMKLNFALFGYFFMIQWFKNLNALLKPMLLYTMGLVPVILLIIQAHAAYNFMPQVAFSICQPFYDEHTVYAASIAFIIPALVFVGWNTSIISSGLEMKILIAIGLIIVILGFGLTFSRAAWLSVLVSAVFLVLLLLRVRPIFYLTGLLLLVAIALGFKGTIENYVSKNQAVSNDGDVANHLTSVTNVSTDASNLERINRWVCAVRMFKEKPVFGFGPGTYQFEYSRFQTMEYETRISTRSGDRGNAHSEYLMYLSETGLPGFLIFLATVVFTFFLGIRNNLNTSGYIRGVNNTVLLALTTFFFHGIFNSFIDQDKMAILVYSSMAALAAIDVYHINKNEKAIL